MRQFLVQEKARVRLTGGLEDRRRFNKRLRAWRGNPNYVPEHLTPSDRAQQTAALRASRAAYKDGRYVDRPSVPSFRPKPSQHVQRAKRRFNVRSMSDFETLAERTGCSVDSLEKIVEKGRGAYYSGGSRPNQTPTSWGLARLASSLTGGPAKKYDLKVLEEGGCGTQVLSAGEDSFPWLTYEEAVAWRAKAAKEKVSEVARGPGGFMDVYSREKTPARMAAAMYSKTQSWGQRRTNFIKRHLPQYVRKKTRRRRLALIMWAYDPGP